ncbi:MAG: cyclic 3,5-adenosine monophosphate phosphodiesterase [Firmicutes bacterium]|nr:cyclic 3,5-adenosine monophosphate phosphodiesterase [Bacillota bacterium]
MFDDTKDKGCNNNETLSRRHFLQIALGTTVTLALNPLSNALAAISPSKPIADVNFAVLSDIHYYAPELGTTGSAFETYLAGDRKMLTESHTTLISAIDTVKKSNAEIVLICGDLTKDGELICHQRVADMLSGLTECGKKALVINGNHDIYNPNAYSYSGASQTRVPTIGPDDFKNIYSEFGYRQAIATDPNSLSYVVEPVDGLRIIAMDSCKYDANNTLPVTSGALPDSRLTWIKNQLREAGQQGKMIIGMMHHGIVPHFSAQPDYFPEYILDDYDEVGRSLSELGLQVVFTGHFHAQNISRAIFDNNTLLDIETGSLVTYPIPYRFVRLSPDKNRLAITSSRVTHTAFSVAPLDFQRYAKKFTAGNMKELFIQQLTAIIMQLNAGLSQSQAAAMAAKFATTPVFFTVTVSDLFVNAMLAHYCGDVDIDGQTQAIYQALAASEDSVTGQYQQVLGKFLLSIGTASPLGDNNLIVNCKNGKNW